jgi:hypothetical protein
MWWLPKLKNIVDWTFKVSVWYENNILIWEVCHFGYRAFSYYVMLVKTQMNGSMYVFHYFEDTVVHIGYFVSLVLVIFSFLLIFGSSIRPFLYHITLLIGRWLSSLRENCWVLVGWPFRPQCSLIFSTVLFYSV